MRSGSAIPPTRISPGGSLRLTLDLGRASLGATLFDGNARFEYRLPWELQGGVAYVAVGVNYRVGAASDVLVRNLLHGGPLLTNIDVHTGGLIYSLAYQF